MGDRIDKLTGELIAVAMQRADAPSEAVAALMTAGFAILVRAEGEQTASITLRQIVDKLVARVVN